MVCLLVQAAISAILLGDSHQYNQTSWVISFTVQFIYTIEYIRSAEAYRKIKDGPAKKTFCREFFCGKSLSEKITSGIKAIFERKPSALMPLDGLRACAVMWVFLLHSTIYHSNYLNMMFCYYTDSSTPWVVK